MLVIILKYEIIFLKRTNFSSPLRFLRLIHQSNNNVWFGEGRPNIRRNIRFILVLLTSRRYFCLAAFCLSHFVFTPLHLILLYL